MLYPRQSLTVQRYLGNPLLVRGLKFDLRLYVLLTSVEPVQLYLYSDGLVRSPAVSALVSAALVSCDLRRFATKPFNTRQQELGDKCVHLTNYAVNKDTEEFQQNQNPAEFQVLGHKHYMD